MKYFRMHRDGDKTTISEMDFSESIDTVWRALAKVNDWNRMSARTCNFKYIYWIE